MHDSFAKKHLEDTLNQIRNLLKHDAGWNGYIECISIGTKIFIALIVYLSRLVRQSKYS